MSERPICSRYSSLFNEPGQESGVCDPQCDPLTQRRGGDNAEACGSPAPAAPAKGCYTHDLVAFSCSNVPAAAAGLTDRSPAFGNGTAAYSNGCAPGFVPLLVESSDSSTVLCAGMCAPLRTDNTLTSNALGDGSVLGKLPTESAPAPGNATCATGRKGSEAAEDCRFWWWFNRDASGTQLPSPFNDTLGLCLGYTHFHYDNDSDPTTPDRSYPACASLPPRNGTPGPDGTADQWGCYNSVDANARAAPHANRTGDFRRTLGGSATRHILL